MKQGLRSSSGGSLRGTREISREKSSDRLPLVQTSMSRNVTEQLRGNHIDTLYALQEMENENERLREEILQLRARSRDSNPDETASRESEESKNSLQILQKDKEISFLRGKVASLELETRTLAAAAEQSSSSLQAMMKASATLRIQKNVSNVQTINQETPKDESSGKPLEQIFCLEGENAKLREEIVRLSQLLSEQEALTAFHASENLKNAANAQSIEADLKALQEELHSQKIISLDANTKAANLELELKSLLSQQDKFEDELVRKWTETKKLLEIEAIRSSQFEKLYQEALSKVKLLEQKGNTFELTTATEEETEVSSALDVVALNVTLEQQKKPISQGEAPGKINKFDDHGNFRFEEFVRLKKENRSLKLQLAEALEKRDGSTRGGIHGIKSRS